ncbi:Inner membrane protein YbaN [Ruegeria denitrificans]|uniref:Inner membrane protein YbaN n=1 Tax=Ruegeria denitrificans TaxID=1715692 RepID=A0A0N7MAN1_9RHOB|nr:YbaN family protein [Ruegeria denitrificans]CUK13739.1 Inner membrane protein YbaN [Ruegeria denitrificans]
MQYVWAALGLICVGFAVIGVVLPLLPTVPFLLLAAFFFARSSTRLHTWLITHRTFGPLIVDWQSYGAIRPSAKKAATVSVAAVFGLSVLLALPAHVLIIQAVVLGAVMVFIWSRPNG